MKVNSTIYKGIEYIQVRELPPDQQELLLQSINHELFIKIMVEGQLVGNCLQFKDYEVWFDRVFKAHHDSSSHVEKPFENAPIPTIISMEALKKSN
jgi:hypothetical protein